MKTGHEEETEVGCWNAQIMEVGRTVRTRGGCGPAWESSSAGDAGDRSARCVSNAPLTHMGGCSLPLAQVVSRLLAAGAQGNLPAEGCIPRRQAGAFATEVISRHLDSGQQRGHAVGCGRATRASGQ